jgi:hypothetical protein
MIGSALAFLSAPLILFLGRTRRVACSQGALGPCDPGLTSPGWTLPALIAALTVGVVLAAAAIWRATRDRQRLSQ